MNIPLIGSDGKVTGYIDHDVISFVCKPIRLNDPGNDTEIHLKGSNLKLISVEPFEEFNLKWEAAKITK